MDFSSVYNTRAQEKLPFNLETHDGALLICVSESPQPPPRAFLSAHLYASCLSCGAVATSDGGVNGHFKIRKST